MNRFLTFFQFVIFFVVSVYCAPPEICYDVTDTILQKNGNTIDDSFSQICMTIEEDGPRRFFLRDVTEPFFFEGNEIKFQVLMKDKKVEFTIYEDDSPVWEVSCNMGLHDAKNFYQDAYRNVALVDLVLIECARKVVAPHFRQNITGIINKGRLHFDTSRNSISVIIMDEERIPALIFPARSYSITQQSIGRVLLYFHDDVTTWYIFEFENVAIAGNFSARLAAHSREQQTVNIPAASFAYMKSTGEIILRLIDAGCRPM